MTKPKSEQKSILINKDNVKKKPKDLSQLREGFTTGACSAAAAKAAARVLLRGEHIDEITSTIPIGKKVTFKLKRCERYDDHAICSILKDAGDDPDCTDKAELIAKVSLTKSPQIEIVGGEGIALVTKAGLGLEVGKHAINPVPRKNITEMVQEEMEGSDFNGAQIEIAVPGGEEMAKQTTNERLGLIGGISILGTTGIVKPYSTAAFRASVVQSVDLVKNNNLETIVLTTGGKSEQYAMELFPFLDNMSFIQVGDFIGTALKRGKRNKIKNAIIVGMMGKLSKMADGRMMTHAAGSKVNMEMLAMFAKDLGATSEVVEEIQEAATARRVLEICEEQGIKGMTDIICEKVVEACSEHSENKLNINTYLVGFSGNLLGRFEQNETIYRGTL
mgnify:CR=1 FL=1